MEAMNELRRAINALRLEVPEAVANDIERIVDAVAEECQERALHQVELTREMCELRDRVKLLEGRDDPLFPCY